MKKTLVTLLALVFVLGIAGTAFAAPANPFVDVPAKHWAYGAVSKLAKAGIVDGYGDGTFRGDRTMTRYEMAQIVAKAMAKSEKADAEMKALIDKLAVEFAAELNNLGVRVAKLEAKTNVGLTFESRLRWGNDDAKVNAGTNQFDVRQRIYLAGVVNDKIDYGARFQTESVKFGGSKTYDLHMNRMFFNIKDFAGIDKMTLGRFPTLYFTEGLLSGRTDGSDGVAITTKLGENTTLKAYMVNPVDNGNGTPGANNDQNTVTFGGFEFQLNKDVSLNVAYQTANFKNFAWADGGRLKVNSVDVGGAAKMGDFWFKGEYVNSKDKMINTTRKAYNFELSNSVTKYFAATTGMVDAMKAHTDAFAVGYRSIDPNATPVMSAYNGQLAVIGTTVAAAPGESVMKFDNNVKGWYVEYQNVLSKGLVFSFDYQDLKAKIGNQKDKTWMGRFEFYF